MFFEMDRLALMVSLSTDAGMPVAAASCFCVKFVLYHFAGMRCDERGCVGVIHNAWKFLLIMRCGAKVGKICEQLSFLRIIL